MIATVTGGSGHLGNNVVRALLERGDTVRAIFRYEAPSLRGLDVEHIRVDVRDLAGLTRAIAKSDVVYHAAGVISLHGSQGGLVEAVNVGARATCSRPPERPACGAWCT